MIGREARALEAQGVIVTPEHFVPAYDDDTLVPRSDLDYNVYDDYKLQITPLLVPA
jgi:hypothetical protein